MVSIDIDSLIQRAKVTHKNNPPASALSSQVQRILGRNRPVVFSRLRTEEVSKRISRISMKKFRATNPLVPPVL